MLRRKYESSLSNFFLHIKHTSKKSFIIIRADLCNLCNLWAVNNLCFICFTCFIYKEISVEIRAIRGKQKKQKKQIIRGEINKTKEK